MSEGSRHRACHRQLNRKGAKGSRQNGFPSIQAPVARAELLPFLLGHPGIEAIEPQSRSGQMALFPKEETKQASAFLIFQSTFRGWLWPNVTLLHLSCIPIWYTKGLLLRGVDIED